MSALVRITTGIMPQHSRVGMTRAMAQFGEVIHCHKPPYSGIPGEDFVNVRFGTQDAADRAYQALKGNQVFVDGFVVGCGPVAKPEGGPGSGGGGGMAIDNGWMRRRTPSPPRRFGRDRFNRNRSPDRPYARRLSSPPRRRRSPTPPRGVANFPSRNDPKSPSPRRLAREMHLNPRSKSRSRPREVRETRRYREDRVSEFSVGPGAMRVEKPARTPSPDPPGPVKNSTPVKNPFFRARRSPSPDMAELLSEMRQDTGNGSYQAVPAQQNLANAWGAPPVFNMAFEG